MLQCGVFFFAAVVLSLLVPVKGRQNASAHQEIWGNFIFYKCNKTDLNLMEEFCLHLL